MDLPNGTQTTQSYDGLERLTQVVNKKTGGADLNKFAYAYDNRDVRTGVQQQYGTDPLRQVNYTYDGVDQLVGEAATGGTAGTNYTNAFTYDAMGNRLKLDGVAGSDTRNVKSSVNGLNQLTSVSSTVNNGAPTTTGLAYDVAGNLTNVTNADGSKTLYNYDDADRLYRVEKHDAQDAPLSKSEFIYDYASRKAISREFAYTAGAWVQTDEKRRVFDGLDVVQERNAANQVTAQLVRDGNIGGILSRSTSAGASFYGYDGGGNVTLLTDENGNDVGRYRYDAFGNTLEASGTRASENPYRFSSKEYDATSGLYDFGFRFYSTGLGRWINRDPLEEDGGVNLYDMVDNDPVNSMDEYGLTPDYSKTLPEAKNALDGLMRDLPGWRVVQAYRPPGTNSGLTHDVQHGKGNSGGAVAFDLSVRGKSSTDILNMLKALPQHGFIGWYRHWYTGKGKRRKPNFHIHIVYACAAEQHSGSHGHFAGDQVDAWLQGRDGLGPNTIYHYRGRSDQDTPVDLWSQEQIDHIREGHERANPISK